MGPENTHELRFITQTRPIYYTRGIICPQRWRLNNCCYAEIKLRLPVHNLDDYRIFLYTHRKSAQRSAHNLTDLRACLRRTEKD